MGLTPGVGAQEERLALELALLIEVCAAMAYTQTVLNSFMRYTSTDGDDAPSRIARELVMSCNQTMRLVYRRMHSAEVCVN
jgi:hypothetical protein